MIAHNKSCPIETTCYTCGDSYQILIDLDDFDDWVDGKGYAQDIFHYLTENERELIISATCPLCWDLFEKNMSANLDD